VVNADTHIGATNWLMTEGRAFRDRVVFAAFDEMPYSPLLQFCRFAVEQPIAEIGKTAARMVLERIAGEGGPRPRTVRLPTRLIQH
jgi:LacI family transcriptional regulator